MKRHFVLDENVLILAQKIENDRGEPDDTSLQLVRAIDANCHSLVISDACSKRWAAQLSAVGRTRSALTPNVMSILKSLISNRAKDHQFLGPDLILEIPELKQLPAVDEGDRDFVQAAASVPGSVLASTDGPLLEALGRNGITERFRFEALDPVHALSLAGPD